MSPDTGIDSVIRDIHEKVTRTDTLMVTLIGPGGRIPILESDVRQLREDRAAAQATIKTTATFWGVLSGAVGLVGHFVWDALRGGHAK